MGQINEPHDTVQPTATASHDIRAVLLLTRRDCPQCEAARSRLHELAAEMGFEVRETALESDPALNERYGVVAPVVRVGGLTLLSGEIEREELRAEIERAFGPAPLADVPPEEEEFLSVLHCPACEGPLESRPRAAVCLRCGREYGRRGGVLLLQAVPERERRFGFTELLGKLIQFKLTPPKTDARSGDAPDGGRRNE